MKKLISMLLLAVVLTSSGCVSSPRYVQHAPSQPRVIYYYPYYDLSPRYYTAPSYSIITWRIGVGIGGHEHRRGHRR